jgi:hypothetical protein
LYGERHEPADGFDERSRGGDERHGAATNDVATNDAATNGARPVGYVRRRAEAVEQLAATAGQNVLWAGRLGMDDAGMEDEDR